MAKSNKPAIWGPFAAGGTLTALLTPVLILLTLLAAVGHTPRGLEYGALNAFLTAWPAKVAALAVVALSLWSSAHRLRITFFDFGARCDGPIGTAMYLLAAAGTGAAALYLIRL